MRKFIFLQLIFCGYAMFGYRDDFWNNQVRPKFQSRTKFLTESCETRSIQKLCWLRSWFRSAGPSWRLQCQKVIITEHPLSIKNLLLKVFILLYTFETLSNFYSTWSVKLGGSEAAYSASQIDSKNLVKSRTSRPWSDKNTSSLKVSIFVTNFFPTRHCITRSMARTVRNWLDSRVVHALRFVNSSGLI